MIMLQVQFTCMALQQKSSIQQLEFARMCFLPIINFLEMIMSDALEEHDGKVT